MKLLKVIYWVMKEKPHIMVRRSCCSHNYEEKASAK
jgi:hypothetical protein